MEQYKRQSYNGIANHEDFVMNGETVTVIMDGVLANIEAKKLQVGDMVVVQAGDIVPADINLVKARGLEVDEFELTGEIMPVIKHVNDDNRRIYMGSRVVKGNGEGKVVAIGEQTEYGKIIKQEWEEKAPYRIRIYENKYLILPALLLPAFVIYFVHTHYDIILPITYLLLTPLIMFLQNDRLFKYFLVTHKQKRLERQGIQIRDPESLEVLNDIDIICFDKTGILTTRQMDIKQVYFGDGVMNAGQFPEEQAQVAEYTHHITKLACALCHDVNYIEKLATANPIDKALISFAMKEGVNVNQLLTQSKRVYDKPFDSENRYMACGYEIEGREYYFAKGDPGIIVNMCRRYLTVRGTENKLDGGFFLRNQSNISTITQTGDTAIALAFLYGNPEQFPHEYTFLGLIQLENPLQLSATNTIRVISSMGLKSFLLTGDREKTAIKIGVDSGISSDSKAVLTGNSIERMSWVEIARQSSYCSVFARLTPSQKGILVLKLQQAGHKVIMVGDGPNDGVALRLANIGISMLKNSSIIARRLSNILITDLSDLVRLLQGARWIQRNASLLRLLRILILTGTIVGAYVWVFINN